MFALHFGLLSTLFFLKTELLRVDKAEDNNAFSVWKRKNKFLEINKLNLVRGCVTVKLRGRMSSRK